MSNFYYCPSLHTFLVQGLHPKIPADSVKISHTDYLSLLEKQSQGLHIIFDPSINRPVARPASGPPEPELLDNLYRQKVAEINSACEATIIAGFWSSALGEPHQYPSKLDDQLNLTGVILQGFDSRYGCRDKQGVKELRLHTAKQLRQVSDDFTTYKLELLQRYNVLKQQLAQALSNGEMNAMQVVTWESLQP
ncbi:DUF4376 domain-containing protein [Pseudomonas sp. CCOS 191]|uniref:DUF4376 domain-containing protein n=1 Tax=Pseudomonas sp. CCOS 191 TaxID=1649877 RepID=UPI0006244C21|nr:hypothetical protein [Pseudomonas sp. CCOS 191]CRI59124.1 hypothetical protein CCOS191_4588 [Pseudomonas sp. CCOS 191]